MRRIVALVAVGLALVVAWRLWPSDERRIARALERLEGACGKSGPDGPLALLDKTETIIQAFAPGFLVAAEPYEGTITDARRLAGLVHQYRASVDRVVVRDSERSIEVGSRGTAEMSVRFLIDAMRGGSPSRESFRARIFWVEVEGRWKIRELRITERIDRPGLFF